MIGEPVDALLGDHDRRHVVLVGSADPIRESRGEYSKVPALRDP